MGATPSGKSLTGGGVRARAAGAAAAAGGRAGGRGGGAQKVSLGRGRASEGRASVRDGGAENSATGTGERERHHGRCGCSMFYGLMGSAFKGHLCVGVCVRWRT